MIDRWTEKDCDYCGIRFQFTRSEHRPKPDEYVCPECAAYERGAKEGDAELERVTAERDQAQAERDHFMVQLGEAQERGLEAEARAEKVAAEHDVWRTRALQLAAELRKHRPTIGAVYDREAWILAAQLAVPRSDEKLDAYRDLATRAAEAAARIKRADAEKEDLRRALSLAHLLLDNYEGDR